MVHLPGGTSPPNVSRETRPPLSFCASPHVILGVSLCHSERPLMSFWASPFVILSVHLCHSEPKAKNPFLPSFFVTERQKDGGCGLFGLSASESRGGGTRFFSVWGATPGAPFAGTMSRPTNSVVLCRHGGRPQAAPTPCPRRFSQGRIASARPARCHVSLCHSERQRRIRNPRLLHNTSPTKWVVL